VIATLDGIRQFQEITKDNDRTLDDLVLDETQESFLASYLSEKKVRSKLLKLVQDDDVLLENYLKLEARERAQIERWRVKAPEYLEGDYDAEPVVRSGSNLKKGAIRSWKFYREVNSRKAIAKIVELYIQKQPTSKLGPVPLQAWFESYGPRTGQNLRPQKKGKGTTLATASANKYYQQYARLKRESKTTPSFDEWILAQIPAKLKKQLQQTPYYTQRELTIEQTVQLYIKHNPTSKQGPVPLQTWFTSYDPQTAKDLNPQKKGRRNTIATPPAAKYYGQYKKLKQKNKTALSFEEWILKQLTPTTKKQLQKTPLYTQVELTIEQIVQLYIKHKPTTKQGPVPITAWFQSYDPQTAKHLKPRIKGKRPTMATPPANKHYKRYLNLKKKGETTLTFEQLILTHVSEDTKKEYRELRDR